MASKVKLAEIEKLQTSSVLSLSQHINSFEIILYSEVCLH